MNEKILSFRRISNCMVRIANDSQLRVVCMIFFKLAFFRLFSTFSPNVRYFETVLYSCRICITVNAYFCLHL